MGTTGFSASFFSSFSSTFSSVFSSSMHPILGAVLAGLGFWPKAERPAQAPLKAPTQAPANANPEAKTQHLPSNDDQAAKPEKQSVQALRVIRFVETDMPAANAAQMAGRMVISGRMSDVCAELDRLAA